MWAIMAAARDTYDGTNVIRTPTFGAGFPHADETGGGGRHWTRTSDLLHVKQVL